MMSFTSVINRYRVSEDPLLSERRVELLALVLTVLLVLMLLFGVSRLLISAHPQPKLPAADSLVANELLSLGVVSPQQSTAVKARPVFWPSRRPVDAPVEVVVEAKPKVKKSELDKVKLLGIFGVGDSAGIIALVKGAKQRILLGDKVVGWTLESIDRDQAVFTESGQSQHLTLERRAIAAKEPSSPAPKNKNGAGSKLKQNRQLTTGRSSPNNEKSKK